MLGPRPRIAMTSALHLIVDLGAFILKVSAGPNPEFAKDIVAKIAQVSSSLGVLRRSS
jgi:hypothetical protein